jgi:hypothetical protein
MEIKRSKLVDMWNLFESNELKNIDNFRFNYGIIKNKRIIEPEIRAIEEIQKPSDKFMEFQQARIVLCEKHSKKDDKGQPVKSAGAYDIENMDEFNKELEPLKEQYKDTIAEVDEKIKKVNEFIEESLEMDFYKIKQIDMPDKLSKMAIEVLYPLIGD